MALQWRLGNGMTPVRFVQKGLRFVKRAHYLKKASGGVSGTAVEIRMIRSIYARIARELGLEVLEVGPVLEILGNGRVFRVYHFSTEFDNQPACIVAGDKVCTRTLLEKQGVAIPEGRAFGRSMCAEAVAFGLSLGKCVVKPARGCDAGRGVTVDLASAPEIRKAFRLAAVFCDDVLVERFAPGDSYRFLVYKGKCLSVVRREFAQVRGNGRDTVRALIDRENAGRIRSRDWKEGDPVLMPLRVAERTARTLAKQGLTMASVPAEGQRVILWEPANFGSGGFFTEWLSQTNAELIRAAEKAAAALPLEFAGVDILAEDIRRPEYCVNEVNTTSSTEIHYIVQNEERTDPLRTVLRDYFGLQ